MNSYYIYALKDPRPANSPPFYVGKGTGSRAWDHVICIDDSRKGRRIRDIQNAGRKVVVAVLANDLTEIQALKLEAELISAFGIEENGGILTNSVLPSGKINRSPSKIAVPGGALEKAQLGLALLKQAILDLARVNPEGIANADAAKALNLQSDNRGAQKDYLTYSVLGLLLREGRLRRLDGTGKHVCQVD